MLSEVAWDCGEFPLPIHSCASKHRMALLLTGKNPYLQFQWQLEAIPYDQSVFSETILFENETFNFDCELRYGTQLSVNAIKRTFGSWTDITDIVCTVDKLLCCDMDRDEHIKNLWTFCFDVSVERSCTLSFRVHLCENVRQYQHQLIDRLLSEQLWQAAEKKLITDVEFNVEGKIIAAHRSVLAARCPALLIPSESTFVEDASAETFSALLRFIYTGKLITIPNAQLCRLAEKFGLSTLQSLCSLQSESDINAANFTQRSRRKSGAVVRSITGLTVKCVISFPTFPSVTAYQPQHFVLDGQPLFNFTWNSELHKCSSVISSCISSDWRINEIFLRCDNLRPAIFHQKQMQPGEFQAEFNKHHKFSQQEYFPVSIEAYVVPNVQTFEFQPIDIRLPSDLWLLVQKRILADFELVIQGSQSHSFLAHRAILAARSKHFSNMFQSGMKESRSGKVVITDTDVAVFEQLLHFLYTGSVEPFADFEELLAIADMYQIESLINLCETKVSCIL